MSNAEQIDKGSAWADDLYRKLLSDPASLPNYGPGFSNALRAARKIQGIAARKLYGQPQAHTVMLADRRYNPSLSKSDIPFWKGVLFRANELAVEAS